MRLIDADLFAQQLEDYFYHLGDDGGLGACATIQDMLEDQPAISLYECIRNEWISVEERLPKEMQEVLVYRGHHSGLTNTYTYLGNHGWEDDHGYWGRTDDEGITHWMPLPAPPTEKEN